MLRKQLACACVLIFAALIMATAAAQDSASEPLTIGECVKRALKHGFDIELAAQDYAIAREDIPIARSEFYPRISASTGRLVTDYGQFVADPTLPNSLVNTRIDQTIGTIELSQRLPTGTEVGVSVDQYRQDISPTLQPLNPSYTSGVRLTLSQPLLKGFGTRATMFPVKRAETTTDLAGREYESRALDIIESTEIAFYQLVAAREQLRVLQTSLDLARTLHREAQSRFEHGVATRLDVIQAKVGEDNAKLAVLDGERIVSESTRALQVLIGKDELDKPLGSPVLDLTPPSDTPNVDTSVALAQERSPVLQAQRVALAVAQLDVSAAKDDLKLDLGLHAEVGLAGTNRTNSAAFSDALDRQGSDWQVGFQVVYPFGRTAERARSRIASAALKRETSRVDQLSQAIKVEVRNAVGQIDTNRASIDIAKGAVESSELQYTTEKHSFAAGESASRDVLEAQADLERSRLVYLQARLNYFRSRAALRRIEGSAFDHYGVELPKVQ